MPPRKSNIIRGIPPPANKYLFGRQPKWNFGLGVGYLVISTRPKRFYEQSMREFENWLARNHLPPRIRPSHVSVCYESWKEIYCVAARKKPPRAMHCAEAYPPKTWPWLFVLRPATALTMTQAQLINTTAQWMALYNHEPDCFCFAAKVLFGSIGKVMKINPIDFVMDDNYIVDHSIKWENKSSINTKNLSHET